MNLPKLAKTPVELNLEIRNLDPENYDCNYEKLNSKHARFRRFGERRGKEWAK